MPALADRMVQLKEVFATPEVKAILVDCCGQMVEAEFTDEITGLGFTVTVVMVDSADVHGQLVTAA
jgi:hypothetical protein